MKCNDKIVSFVLVILLAYVSEYSKRDIIKFFPFVDEEKIFVTPLAANKSYKPLNKINCIEYIKNKYSIDSPFILYIGGFSTRKNVKELIIAFKKIQKSLKKDSKLVLCGLHGGH